MVAVEFHGSRARIPFLERRDGVQCSLLGVELTQQVRITIF